MKYFLFLKLIILFLLFSGCHKSDSPCDSIEFCTEEFRAIFVTLKFENTTSRNFGHLETILEDTGEKLRTARITMGFPNPDNPLVDSVLLSILNDSHMNKISFDGSTISVRFFDQSGSQIRQEKYTVRHDCCHVEKLSGPDDIIL